VPDQVNPGAIQVVQDREMIVALRVADTAMIAVTGHMVVAPTEVTAATVPMVIGRSVRMGIVRIVAIVVIVRMGIVRSVRMGIARIVVTVVIVRMGIVRSVRTEIVPTEVTAAIVAIVPMGIVRSVRMGIARIVAIARIVVTAPRVVIVLMVTGPIGIVRSVRMEIARIVGIAVVIAAVMPQREQLVVTMVGIGTTAAEWIGRTARRDRRFRTMSLARSLISQFAGTFGRCPWRQQLWCRVIW